MQLRTRSRAPPAVPVGQSVLADPPSRAAGKSGHGRVSVSRVIDTAGLYCKEVVFSVDSAHKECPFCVLRNSSVSRRHTKEVGVRGTVLTRAGARFSEPSLTGVIRVQKCAGGKSSQMTDARAACFAAVSDRGAAWMPGRQHRHGYRQAGVASGTATGNPAGGTTVAIAVQSGRDETG